MTPNELLSILDTGCVEELKIYCFGRRTVVDVCEPPELYPNLPIVRLWNSEDGKGISVLLEDARIPEKPATWTCYDRTGFLGTDDMPYEYECSNCKKMFSEPADECPNCRAKMEVDEKDV